MKITPFKLIDWSSIKTEHHIGETGVATWQTLKFEGLRIRMVEYSPGYLADHWCSLGHIVHCIEGEVENRQDDGNIFVLKPGMSYMVSDNAGLHRSYSKNGVKLLIIDGDFLYALPEEIINNTFRNELKQKRKQYQSSKFNMS